MLNKIILASIITYLLFSFNSFAGSIDYKLTADHGPELKSADFPIRYKFEKNTGVSWSKSTLIQREKFLSDWYKQEDASTQKIIDEKESALKTKNTIETNTRQKISDKNNIIAKNKQKKDDKLRLIAEKKKAFNDRAQKRKQEILELRQKQLQRQKIFTR